MHKNRIIIILGILILLLPELGFTLPNTFLLIQFFAAIVIILAFMIERKGIFSILWSKKNTTTPVAKTYIEHNGVTPVNPPVSPGATTPISTVKE